MEGIDSQVRAIADEAGSTELLNALSEYSGDEKRVFVAALASRGSAEDLLEALSSVVGDEETLLTKALAVRGEVTDLLEGLDIVGSDNEKFLAEALVERGEPSDLVEALGEVNGVSKEALIRVIIQDGSPDDLKNACEAASSFVTTLIDELITQKAESQLKELLAELLWLKGTIKTVDPRGISPSKLIRKLLFPHTGETDQLLTGVLDEIEEQERQIRKGLDII